MAAEEHEKRFIHAFREVRNYIFQNHLQAGDILPGEVQLSQEIGVSRNVLREAIKSMELMGLVKACPGRGTEVMDFSLDFLFQHVLFFNITEDNQRIRQIFEIRKTLELGHMRQAFESLGARQIAHLRDLAGRMRSSWEATGSFAREDAAFHQALFAQISNQLLLSLLGAIWAVDSSFRLGDLLPDPPESIHRHEAIVQALEGYDYLAFANAMYQHYAFDKYQPLPARQSGVY